MAGGARGDELYATEDAGVSWTRVSVSTPMAFKFGSRNYDVPTFFDDKKGVLPVTFSGSAHNSGFAFYSTEDGGQTWTIPGPVIPSVDPINAGVRHFAEAVSPNVWIEVPPAGHKVAVFTNQGEALQQKRSDGLPSGVVLLDFATPNKGWAISAIENCPGKTDCVFESSGHESFDQGQSWVRLRPP